MNVASWAGRETYPYVEKWCSASQMLRKPRVSAAWAMSRARWYISVEGRADGDCMRRNVPNLMVMSPSPRSESGMGKTGRPDPKGVHGGASGEEERLEIRRAEGEVGGHFGSADDAEPLALAGEHPGAAGPGAEDASFGVHLHAVGHAVRLVGGHVGEDAPPDHPACRVQLEHVDVLGPARVGDVEEPLVRGEGEAVRVLEVGDQAGRSVGHHAIDARVGHLALGERHTEPGVGEVDAPVGLAHHVVGAVEQLALVAVHEHVDAPVGSGAGHAPVVALAEDEAPLEIERRSVASARLVAHDLGRLPRHYSVEHARSHVDEVVEAVRMPERTLGEDEPRGQPLRLAGLQDRCQLVAHVPLLARELALLTAASAGPPREEPTTDRD